MKKVTVFFDHEGWWEAPYRGKFDLRKNTKSILKILDKYDVKAVFNTCGVVGEFFPEDIGQIHDAGHEIASHGYRHENFAQLSRNELNSVLAKTEKLLSGITGEKIVGIRSPWAISNENVHSVFVERGYRWTSNDYTPFPELYEKPTQKKQLFYTLAAYYVRIKHAFFYTKRPYLKKGITEIPMLSSSDGDLLSLINAEQNSPQDVLAYAAEAYKSQFRKSAEFFNLNFHPWIIGSSNRPLLLDKVLGHLSKQTNIKFLLARDLIKNA